MMNEQQKIAELSSAALRALTGQGDLHFRSGVLRQGKKALPLFAPHLQNALCDDDFSAFRGVSDSASLRLNYSDLELHRMYCPAEPVERLVFELLEQLRVDSLVPDSLPGMLRNVTSRFREWSRQFHRSGLSDTHLGLLIYTITQICWSRLNNCPVLEESEDFIEATRAGIAPLIGNDLAALKRYRHSQEDFACHAIAIAKTVGGLIESAQQGVKNSDDEVDERDFSQLHLLLDFDEQQDEAYATADSGHSKLFEENQGEYRVFTREFDRQVMATDLVRSDFLNEKRHSLDKRLSALRLNLPLLARQLEAIFALPQRDGWLFGMEEGYIDGRRLSQLSASRSERRLFKQERYLPGSHSLVTFLVDCSGSMKTHAEQVALLIDIFSRALETAGVLTEVLGFTTNTWNGGRAMQQWMKQGRPANPGRLNEACFMVVKSAQSSWRRSRKSIASLLKADLFREGLDGEAVEWACQRMLDDDYHRRVLIVVSDGCPMDTATNLANDAWYLDNHLKTVIEQQQRQGLIEIIGLGLGLDLTPFYERNLALDPERDIDNQTLQQIVQLLGRRFLSIA